MKQITISYESDGAKGTIIDARGDIPLQKSYVHKSSTNALVIYDEIIKVTIMLDGNSQTIDLKKTL